MHDLLTGFRHYIDLPIRYGDIDMLQHVNNARYLTYAEQARVAYATDVLCWDGDWRTLNMILARVEVDYLQPLWLTDRLRLYTRCARLGHKSYTLEYLYIRLDAGLAPRDLAARCRSVLVAYDVATQQSRPVPEAWRAAILAYEPVPPES